MGHQVYYTGNLKLKNPITYEQEEFLEKCHDDYNNYDRLYALVLNKERNAFIYEDNDKIYEDSFYKVIIDFIEEFKKLGNDIEHGSFLLSESEYEDEPQILLIYLNGKFYIKDFDRIKNIQYIIDNEKEYYSDFEL